MSPPPPGRSPLHDPDLDGPPPGSGLPAGEVETRPAGVGSVLIGMALILIACPIVWGMTWHAASIAVGRPWWLDEDAPPAHGRPSFAEAFPPILGGGAAFAVATFIAAYFFRAVPSSPGRGKPR